jgi:uncharacterized protein
LRRGSPRSRAVAEELLRVERAEECLRGLGFRQYQRAATTATSAASRWTRRTCPGCSNPGSREQLVETLRGLGYRHVTVDLAGYRTGSTA